MKPPVRYYGGKIRLAQWIVDVMQRYEFDRYVEPFGGSGAVLFAKQPSKCEVYNDLYSDLVNMYKVLRSPTQYKQFIRLTECTPYSREAYTECQLALKQKKMTDVERARCFFVVLRQSFSCLMNGWSTPSESSYTGAAKTYMRSVDQLPEVHRRLQRVHIEHMDALDCIKRYVNGNSLIYCDPPYVHATRLSKND